MSDENEITFIETKPEKPEREQMEEALDKLDAQRSGEEVAEEEERDEPAPENPRDEREAYEQLQEREELRKNIAEQKQEAEQQKQAREAEASVEKAAQWTPGEHQKVQAIQSEVARHQQEVAAFNQILQKAQADPSRVTPSDEAQLQEAAQRLQQQEAQLQQAGKVVQQASTLKQAAKNREKLFRDFPELKDAGMREELVEWAKKHGYSEEDIRSTTDRSQVGRAFTQFKAEKDKEREKHRNRPRKVPYKAGPLSRGGPTPPEMTDQQAMDRLRQTGSFADALNLAAIRREKNAES